MEIFYGSIITGIFTISGVIIGALLTFFLQWFSNRRKLNIIASVRVPVSGGVIGEKNIYVTITNSCSRPIYVVGLEMTMEDGIKGVNICQTLPKVLYESEYTIERINIEGLPDVNKKNHLKNICVFDSLRNKWNVQDKDIKKINLEIDKIINN